MTSPKNSWRWWVCGLLLLATMINYMDRLTLNQQSGTIMAELGLSKESEYGALQSGFAGAFAVGALVFGFLADRMSVYWLYPAAVLAWSAAGWMSGLAAEFWGLLACRIALGFAESAHWPCALRTTQRVLPPEERGMGNSLLQSGAAVGSIALPLLLLWLVDPGVKGSWRLPFQLVGAMGAGWVLLWLVFLRPADLARPVPEAGPKGDTPLPAGFARRVVALLLVVVAINSTWHCLVAWGPRFLEGRHGYTPAAMNWFMIGYFVSADVGSLMAGGATLWLARRGLSVHASRVAVFAVCSAMCLSCIALPWLEGVWLQVAFLVAAFGSLGVFPCYYSFTQDLTEKHQGKLTGSLGFSCWAVLAGWHYLIGRIVDATGSYAIPFAVSGAAPLLALAAITLLWGETPRPAPPADPPPSLPPEGITSRPREVSAAGVT